MNHTRYTEDMNLYQEVDGLDLTDPQKFQPMPKHVLLRWLQKEVSKGGVIIPQTRWRKNFAKAVVLAVGPDTNPRLERGALVSFNINCEKQWLGDQVRRDLLDTMFFCEDANVLGTVEYPEDNSDPQIHALDKWILVEADPSPENLAPGIAVSQAHKDRPRILSKAWPGTVLSVGELAGSCVPGDRILYETYGSLSLMAGDQQGKSVVAIMDEFVLGYIESEETKAQQEAVNV